MKKLFFVCLILMGVMAFTSCKNETVKEEEVCETAIDSVEVVEVPADSLYTVE